MKKTGFQPFAPAAIGSSPLAVLDLASHRVDIWRARLDLPTDSLMTLEATLSADEIQRAERFHVQGDKDRFIAAHGCLRDILARYHRLEPAQLSFSANDYGKPALSTDLSERRMDFNLSHSDDFALVAVTWERKVGVDLERIRQGISAQVIARQYFSKSEFAELPVGRSQYALLIRIRRVAGITVRRKGNWFFQLLDTQGSIYQSPGTRLIITFGEFRCICEPEASHSPSYPS